MKNQISDKIKNRFILIIFLAITSLMITSIIPLIEISNYQDYNQDLDLNINSMKATQDQDLLNFVEKIENINILLWSTIILSIFSFLGTVINFYNTKFFSYTSKIFVMFGLPILFISILIFLFHYDFMNQVINLDGISLAYFVDPNLKYLFIPTIFVFIMIVLSVFYFIDIIKFLVFKDKNIKQKLNDKNQRKFTDIEDIKKYRERDIIKWLSDEVEKLEPVNDKEYNTQKRSEIEENKGYTIRCPQCKHLFTIKDIKNVKKVKCPKCGKVGTLDQ